MNRFSKRLLFSAASVLAVASAGAGASYAQEAEGAQEDTKTLDTIVVTGIRASISKSVLDKREASKIVDTINAEDIGKSTDQNIAEALNRVSGISISTVDGEGSQVSIRGASPNQTIVTLNGAALGSTEFGQAVDLSSYSADVLAKVEVIKTPAADDEEGSLGGLVNLITRKPLDIEDNIRSFGVQGRYSEQPNVVDRKLNGTLSQKFFNDRFGVLVSVVDETSALRRDYVEHRDYNTFRSFNAEDQNGNVYTSDSYDANNAAIYGIAPQSSAYGLFEGTRDRQAIDSAFQWQITDKTDLTVNLSFAKQDIDNIQNEHTVRSNDQVRSPNFGPFSAVHPTTLPLEETNQVPIYADPSNWQIVNTDTRTWERILKRFDTGDVNSSANRYSNENSTASFELNHEFTDNLRVKAGASYQKAEQIPELQIYANLQAARELPESNKFFVPTELLQPIGFDCRGGRCQPVTGTHFVDLGDVITQPSAEQIAQLEADGVTGVIGQPILTRGDDNVSLTGVNPDDLLAKSLGSLFQTKREVLDEQQTAFIDIDYDVNRFGLTSIEVGGKYTKREKFVDNQAGTVTNLNSAATIVNPITGKPVLVSNALDQTPLQSFARRVSPDGLFDGIGLGENNIADGFMSVDAEALFNAVTGDPDLAITINNAETRGADFENFAGYIKTNFSYFDERLTGNIGVRYVKTEVQTEGFGGLQTFNEAFGRNQRIWDLRTIRGLTNTALPACPDAWNYPDGEVAQGDIYRYSRIDGTGVDTKGTATFLDDTRIADQGACHEPLLATGDIADVQAGDRTILRRHNNTFYTNNDFYVFDDDPSNGEGFVTTDAAGLSLTTRDNRIKSFPTTGQHEYDVWLPSMNLNFLVTDDIVARFAASKSMTRPNIDSLRPGFSVSEAGWGDPATRLNSINLYNTQLNPLESINIDTSFEWYFQKDALLSIGVFYKDITNLEESEQQNVYLTDLRSAIQNGDTVSTDGLILTEDTITIDNCYAEILGEWQLEYNPTYIQEMIFGNDPEFLCAQFRASQVRNAAGATIKGVELQYTQNYSFLPGVFSGLGLTANYTYQDSSFEQETSNLAPGTILPSFQIDRTPEHSYNVTGYWQQDGHQMRLAYGGASDVLVQRAFQRGALWEEGRETLDFSASYKLNDFFTLSFDAANLLDQPVRTYFTSRTIQLPENATDGGGALVAYDEGNPLDGDAFKGRTVAEYNTGRVFRLGLRAEF
ncbi:TonB-dependent receptor [Hirschia litorea]|uniref:TonB-dependent receptor n=1 Tax=Hirschia litorea TaxID=1199156 RepID=A0ABW2IPI0_9PROT